MRKLFNSLVVTLVLAVAPTLSTAQSFKDPTVATTRAPVIWTDPGDIRSRDLFYGPGGKEHQPKLPFAFVDEEKGGKSPKFNVKDADGTKWKAKVGPEARPEIVSSRLLWAVGYEANVNYLIPEVEVGGLPAQLSRGNQYRMPNGKMREVRFQRTAPNKDKIGDWSWRKNPFKGTREFNGLRVMMAVINNWDLKDANNARLTDKRNGALEYEVTDVGGSFGPTHRTFSEKTKGNLKVYGASKFITKRRKDYVDFGIVGMPPLLLSIFDPPYMIMEWHRRWIGKHIPREHAKWVGSLLGQLSEQQLRDAFRAANYPPDQIDGFVAVLQKRIAELQQL
jgi:hypothetical protein